MENRDAYIPPTLTQNYIWFKGYDFLPTDLVNKHVRAFLDSKKDKK